MTIDSQAKVMIAKAERENLQNIIDAVESLRRSGLVWSRLTGTNADALTAAVESAGAGIRHADFIIRTEGTV